MGPGNVRNNGERYHAGNDIYASSGSRVNSVMKGNVVSSGNSTDYGNYVTVQHTVFSENTGMGPFDSAFPLAQTYYSFYAHLTTNDVQTGDAVTMGQQIGTSGTTGNANGMTGDDEHLHFEVGTELRSDGALIQRSSLVNPNLFYNGVSFRSSDPNANQGTTGIIKTDGNGVTMQPVGQTQNDYRLQGREVMEFLIRMLGNL